MLMDEAEVVFMGGHGGPGIVSFGPKQGSGPDGGNGGRGGDLYVLATSDITLINQFSAQQSFAAQNGHPGGKNRQSGKDGLDTIIKLPVGTSLIDQDSGNLIGELTEIDQKVLLCEGGLGGRGNYEFRSSRNTTPMNSQPGLPGDRKNLKIVLKLIADYGLVGLPNAGKSSILNELTNAHAKTANYAFTTLSPNLGVIKGRVLADIPGLIEGASEGKGLGISFLKHIEKVGVILHCISAESENIKKDYQTVRIEMGNYNSELLKKPEIIVITKSDMVGKEKLQQIKKALPKKVKATVVSIHDLDSLENLSKLII